MDHFFFINSSVDGHFGCFHILAIVKVAAVQLLQPLSSRFWSSQVRGPTLGLLDGMVARFYISFVCVCVVQWPLTVAAFPVAEHRLWTSMLSGYASRA